MLAAQLPSWANSENLKWITIGVIVGMIVLMLLVLRFIQKLVLKGTLFGIFAIIGLVVFIAILKNRIDSGVKHVVRYSPDLPAADFWECDADKLLQRLSDAARDG